MNIRQAAERSGVAARNIRYYEQAGLLTPARNSDNDYRIYTDADVRTLKLIRMLRTLDMPVEDIRAVLSGTLPLAQAAAAQQARLAAEREKLAAAEHFCGELAGSGKSAAALDVDACLARMDSPAPAGGWFADWVQDYRKMAEAEHKRAFTFTPDTAVTTPQDFTAALLEWAAQTGADIVVTRESMTPHFMLDGIEYKAARYWSRGARVPLQRVRCEVCEPAAITAAGVEAKRLQVQRALHYAVPVVVLAVLAAVWVAAQDMPLWPDKIVMGAAAAAVIVGVGVRAWWLYGNDRDEGK